VALAEHNNVVKAFPADRTDQPFSRSILLRGARRRRSNQSCQPRPWTAPLMWFALTQPPYGTSMPQSGRRPQHQSRRFDDVRVMSAFPLIDRIADIAACLKGAIGGRPFPEGSAGLSNMVIWGVR
jgi:hypothetical protein